jgi:hypothetical protein
MSELPSDPPKTLDAAEQRFRIFLSSNGYPGTIRWLMRDDVLVDEKRHFWVRQNNAKAQRHAVLQYCEGFKRNLGIALHAVCATEAETFALVFVPADDSDRQYHLMGHGLKLSCPTDIQRASRVENPLKWLYLRLRHGRRSKMLEV